MLRYEVSFIRFANRCLYLMKCWLKFSDGVVKIDSFGFIRFFVMYVCSLVINSGVIFIAGLALHPLVAMAVIVFWSGCRFIGFNPLSPVISIGLKPVCAMMSIFNDSFGLRVDAMRICIFSFVGGCIPVGSLVYSGFSHVILKSLQ